MTDKQLKQIERDSIRYQVGYWREQTDALLAEVRALRAGNNEWNEKFELWRAECNQRAEQAEAERDRLQTALLAIQHADEQRSRTAMRLPDGMMLGNFCRAALEGSK